MRKAIGLNGAGILETGDHAPLGEGKKSAKGYRTDPLGDNKLLGTRETWYAHLASVNLYIVQLRAAVAEQAHRVEQIEDEGMMLTVAVDVLITLQVAMRAYQRWRQALLAALAQFPLPRTQEELDYLIMVETQEKEDVDRQRCAADDGAAFDVHDC